MEIILRLKTAISAVKSKIAYIILDKIIFFSCTIIIIILTFSYYVIKCAGKKIKRKLSG